MNAPVPKSTALLALTIATLVVFPLSLRAVNRMVVSETPPPGYLPSLELRRPREPFQQQVVDRLRYGTPAWVFIGDSTLGTRIDPTHLGGIFVTLILVLRSQVSLDFIYFQF